jgi:hypothetical protein
VFDDSKQGDGTCDCCDCSDENQEAEGKGTCFPDFSLQEDDLVDTFGKTEHDLTVLVYLPKETVGDNMQVTPSTPPELSGFLQFINRPNSAAQSVNWAITADENVFNHRSSDSVRRNHVGVVALRASDGKFVKDLRSDASKMAGDLLAETLEKHMQESKKVATKPLSSEEHELQPESPLVLTYNTWDKRISDATKEGEEVLIDVFWGQVITVGESTKKDMESSETFRTEGQPGTNLLFQLLERFVLGALWFVLCVCVACALRFVCAVLCVFAFCV